ncbi:MAG: exosortase/archaeosortase family protein [Methanosarcinaceae archaeon]|nr:exosortase/archaeosortase family protein [Methanosarcinaceae archaeon]
MKNNFLAWITISIAIVLIRSFFLISGSFQPHESAAYPFVILGLCLVFGCLKKDVFLAQIKNAPLSADPAYVLAGVFIAAISIFMPLSYEPAFMIFSILLTFIGVFIIFFGPAAYLPALLLFVYGFSISIPVILNETLGNSYAFITARLAANAADLIYPVAQQGQLISIVNAQGIRDMIYIDAGCSGSASLAIFITIFSLMLIDIKPRNRHILPLFLFGLLGTSLQNILRLVLLLAANYHFGSEAMWQMHDYAGYILFPVWFSVFVYVYLKVAVAGHRHIHRMSSKNTDPVSEDRT